MNSDFYIRACLQQAKPRLSTLLKLMFSEALAFGQKTLWLGSVIELIAPLGYPERTIRTALSRLAARGIVQIERHGRRGLCRLTQAAAEAMLAQRQHLNTPPFHGAAAAAYAPFQQCFQPLRQLLNHRDAFSDEQAYMVRLLVIHGYQQYRQRALQPAPADHQTYVALYAGCATQAQRHTLTRLQA
ncbi:hypothetical protein GTP45_07705 [Pseudoduganella sp. FT55W]|uniref:Transcriptional repressor PaaX-like N-terminal domain-containing protein n=1 Tax=Duganella rivi TaxID=2666083 RepID=A0A7X4KA51_9BURK|nr:hypothetical protein [Duganella rivi]MYM66711.1 hypothetical protein [Duganella rivi]